MLSLHEFLVQLEGLLPKEQTLHPILLESQRRPASPSDWMADVPDDQKSTVSEFKKKLKEGVQQLEKKMRAKTNDLSSRWWAQGEREVAKAEKICTVGGEDEGSNCDMRNAIAAIAVQVQQVAQAQAEVQQVAAVQAAPAADSWEAKAKEAVAARAVQA